MRCAYPLCRQQAQWTPVVEIPTLRTAGDEKAMIPCSRPTLLLGQEVCTIHKDSYNLAQWISLSDWDHIQEVSHANGYLIPDRSVIAVVFRPFGWTPHRGYLEVERT